MNNSKDTVFLIYSGNIKYLTVDDLIKKFNIRKAQFPKALEISFEEYLELLKSWNEDKYETFLDLLAICDDLEVAKNKVINNVGDFNEAGCYNHAIIIEVFKDMIYTLTEPQSILFYKYHDNVNKYKEIEDEDMLTYLNKRYQVIKKQ